MDKNIEETVTIKQFKDLYQSGLYNIQIDTPDGWQYITDWFDKGPMDVVLLHTTNGFSTICATNHMIECMIDGQLMWLPAGELTEDVSILTYDGISNISSIESVGTQECYDFTVNHPNHRYWGDGISSHNSGKSFVCSGNIVKNAQDQGIYVILIDSENALDESWLHALGVKTSEEHLLRISMSSIDEVAKCIGEFMKVYKESDEEDRPKVLFVIDSLGMLLTPTDTDQFYSGNVSKGDMGRKQKALGALVRNCVNLLGNYNVGMVCVQHSYSSQDQYNPDEIISGGSVQQFSASIVVSMQKFKLKEDEEGNKTKEVKGIRSKCKVMKTRYNQPFTEIEIKIPYSQGMDPYSGLYDLFLLKGLLFKDGMRYAYTDLAGNTSKYYQKEWATNKDNILDLIMSEFNTKIANMDADAVQDELEENEEDFNPEG